MAQAPLGVVPASPRVVSTPGIREPAGARDGQRQGRQGLGGPYPAKFFVPIVTRKTSVFTEGFQLRFLYAIGRNPGQAGQGSEAPPARVGIHLTIAWTRGCTFRSIQVQGATWPGGAGQRSAPRPCGQLPDHRKDARQHLPVYPGPRRNPGQAGRGSEAPPARVGNYLTIARTRGDAFRPIRVQGRALAGRGGAAPRGISAGRTGT